MVIRIITVEAVREHVQTTMAEAAIQRLIDDADQTVVDTYGAHGPTVQTDDLRSGPDDRLLFLQRPAATITTVTEYVDETNLTALDPTDYRLINGGTTLERITSGANVRSSWGFRTLVVYVISSDENPRRRGVVIDLVRLAINNPGGITRERAGDYSVEHGSYEEQQGKILGRLRKMGISV